MNVLARIAASVVAGIMFVAYLVLLATGTIAATEWLGCDGNKNVSAAIFIGSLALTAASLAFAILTKRKWP